MVMLRRKVSGSVGRGPLLMALAVGIGALGLALFSGDGALETPRADAQEATKSKVFDHTRAQHKMECAACHVVEVKGRGARKTFDVEVRGGPRGEQHKPCNNSGCHGELKFGASITREAAHVCLSCHYHKRKVDRAAPVARRRGVSNYVIDAFDHGDHLKRNGGDCKGCHVPSKSKELYDRTPLRRDMTMPGHTECAACHEQLAPKVTDLNGCQGCHRQVNFGTVASGSYADFDNYRVSMAFKPERSRGGIKEPMSSFHKMHAKKFRGASCQDCHNNVMTGAGEVVPLPTKQACANCHNDKQAPGMTGTNCTTCHVVPDGGFQ